MYLKRLKFQQTKYSKSAESIFHSDRLRALVTPMFPEEEYVGIERKYSWKCNTCNTVFEDHLMFGKVPTCPTCYKSNMPYSKVEHEIRNFVRSLGFPEAGSSREVVSPKEVDIWIPEKRIAIEINGIYWHSEAHGGKDKHYHVFKTKVCDNKGIQLLQFWDTECREKRAIVESVIRSKLGLPNRRIHARKCTVRYVSNECAHRFFEDNHLQGKGTYSKRLGLFIEEELVALIGMSKARYGNKHDWELVRFASVLNTQVVGGLSKLIAAFRKDHKGSIVTYADRRISNGKAYTEVGFTYSHTTTPNYWYTHKPKLYSQLVSRVGFQKHKLREKKSYSAKLTEWQIMQLEGYDRVWDCGNEVFVLD